MQNTQLTDAASSVPFIEVLPQAPSGSRQVAGPYEPHQAGLLKSSLDAIVERREHFVAPDEHDEIYIWRRARA